MTKTGTGSEIVRTDSRGRARVSRSRREELLDEFERSGLSGAEFARLAGVKYQTFANWRQARQRCQRGALSPPAERAVKGPPVEWLEAVMDQAQAAPLASVSALLVRLPSGAVLEVATAAQTTLAAALLRAWEKAPC
jgi:hypothetical protein